MKKHYVEMLWTAGMDSTYRLVQLSRMEGVEVQPYYIKGDRASRDYEIDHINKIYDLLLSKEATKATILRPIIIDKHSFEIDKDIINAHNNFNTHSKLGVQYKFLGTFAKEHSGLELSVERDADEEYAFQKRNFKITPIETPIGTKHVIDKDHDPDLYTIFKDFTFPIALDTKQDEIDFFKNNGYEDVMNLTWFCHNPKKGEPCGYCAACLQYVENGLWYRLGEKGQRRYKHRNFYRIPIRIGAFFHRLSSKIFKKQ